ncbi:MAG: hypothetical protein P5702_19305 [Limnospira sp. PMC 1291.21]|uniref:hypothetical protein n=1 Tax=Limnospira TaxID=2596745 RepID=UPI00028040E2|nr:MULTISPECIES: hypothetical protein [Limnospira]EKD05717.1 hypothetical protein SPLC1_S630180 [Arthrospira platensis C1]MDY7055461.1 hypothetical protein [Limnospira fusiformis LS22]QJB27188.1 hypothetical protein HFV01_17130 [Limnospira fusiformis SAG 85.79]MDT9179744.1 hypothetical protein [Limnospira sp. PMC 1238.20]MDT9189958.1 hypothetical protein [Limnospira sp. PMC 894.15]
MRYSRSNQKSEEFNLWPSFTDLMANSFMILSLFLLLAIIKSIFIQTVSDATASRSEQLEVQMSELQSRLQQQTTQVTGLQGEVARLQTELRNRGDRIMQLQGEVERLKSPPVIVLRDSSSRTFDSGSAVISLELGEFIDNKLVAQIKDFAEDYEGYVVEVIGHTDGQVTGGGYSNLDQVLEEVARNNQAVTSLVPGSNADLGLMRALSVVQRLQGNEELQSLGLTFKAYSAAQLYEASGNYASINRTSDPSRRRIEIRFTPKAVEQ